MLELYGIDVQFVPPYISPMVVAKGSLKIALYSREMSESLYVALVSAAHKITFSAEFNSSLTNKSSLLSPYGYKGCLKKSKSNGIENLLSNVFLIVFSWVVIVSAVPSAFLAPKRAFNPLTHCIP